jgi:mRNA-degrading endonuclease toxin of MazEF toxin-antitoxin module
VRSIDKSRLEKKLGDLNPDTMQKVDRAIEISFGLVDL